MAKTQNKINSFFLIPGITDARNMAEFSWRFVVIVSFYLLLRLLMAIHDFNSWVLCSLPNLLHFPFNACKGHAQDDIKNAEPTVFAPSRTCSFHNPQATQEDDKMPRRQVQVVMEKLGMPYDPNEEELEERIGAEEIGALFEDGLKLEDAKEAFDVFDENSDGFIDARELQMVICVLGFGEVSEVEVRRMIGAFDENGDGRIDFSEFVNLLAKSTSPGRGYETG